MALERPTVSVESQQPSGYLEVDDLVVGDGAEAVRGSEVDVHYVGVSASTGAEFDASWNREQHFTIKLGAGQVIKGWDMGLVGMKVGGRRRLSIPPHLGYGNASPTPLIKPGETLIFVVDLIDVR